MASLGSFIEVLKRELFTASKKAPLKTLLTVLVVFAVEKMLTTINLFKCPKEGYRLYGGMFLLAPAFCLTALTLLASSSFWDAVTNHRWTSKCRRKTVCSNFCFELTKASMIGAAWLVIGFGTTDFYVCFRVGATESQITSERVRAQSTIIAWSMLIGIVVIALSYMAMKKCCCPKHNTACAMETLGLQDYERLEKDAALSKFEEEVQLLAERQGKKQVMDILGEVEDGKNACEVVRKARNMLVAKCSQTKAQQGNGRVPNETETSEESMLITTV